MTLLCSYYKMELETERNPQQRQWLSRQIVAAELEVLELMRVDRERLEQENRNMEIALEKIRDMQARRKN
jgi:hypothetical protein